MTGADSGAGIAIEVLVKEHEVVPVRIAPVLFDALEHGTCAVAITQEDARKPSRKVGCDLFERHQLAGTCRTLDLEVVAEVVMELLERFDQQVVDRKPDRPTPVRIA